jgi:hypothetical protein
MTTRALPAAAAVACIGAAWWSVPPTPAALREFGSWFARPALLPFAWSALDEAHRAGDAGEAFARARQILQLLPAWTDGHVAFAYRFALEDGTIPAADRPAAALRRLQTALLWLEGARSQAGRREVELLQAMAFLPGLAAMQEPGLEDLMRPGGGSAALGDHYLSQAEHAGGGAAVREQRTFLAPRLCAGLLAAGDPSDALAVLDAAFERSAEVRDLQLADEWRARLDEARRWLRGDRGVDLARLHSDPRFSPLLPHLR